MCTRRSCKNANDFLEKFAMNGQKSPSNDKLAGGIRLFGARKSGSARKINDDERHDDGKYGDDYQEYLLRA